MLITTPAQTVQLELREMDPAKLLRQRTGRAELTFNVWCPWCRVSIATLTVDVFLVHHHELVPVLQGQREQALHHLKGTIALLRCPLLVSFSVSLCSPGLPRTCTPGWGDPLGTAGHCMCSPHKAYFRHYAMLSALQSSGLQYLCAHMNPTLS